jgi:hypothetical protein
MMGLDLNLEPNIRDRRFMCHQLWRRTLEIQVRLRVDSGTSLSTDADKVFILAGNDHDTGRLHCNYHGLGPHRVSNVVERNVLIIYLLSISLCSCCHGWLAT